MIEELFQKQQEAKGRVALSTYAERKEKLKKILTKVLDSKEEIAEAIRKDFNKPAAETELTEILPLTMELRNTIRNLRYWMKPLRTRTPLMLFGSKGKIVYRPKGTVLIISPWNYPFLLALGPLVSAVAAGNTIILKPSEITPNTSKFLAGFFKDVFDESEIAVVEGGKETAQELLKLPFDHIFFTGGTEVGKIVMKAAAENLTSVTLELGGKSPVFIDRSANLKHAAERIVWGKFLNAGQTCIAPDYVLIRKEDFPDFLKYSSIYIEKYYGKDLARNPSETLCNIVNEKNVARLKFLLNDAIAKGAVLEYGDATPDSGNFIAPRILSNVSIESEIMKQEIFGPILPVLFYEDINDAIKIIERNPYPLSLYYFGKNNSVFEKLTNKITAGGVVANDVVVHFANTKMPFGGVRPSGLGKAHGYAGFKAFSNETPVLKQPRFTAVSFFYPLYNSIKQKLLSIFEKTL